MRFITYDLSLDLVSGMREPLAVIRRHSTNLARHASEALESIALNIADARGRYGGDSRKQFASALGSLRELNAAVDIARAAGVFVEPPLARERDRLGGMLFRLSRR
jgi:four helix bundle protein